MIDALLSYYDAELRYLRDLAGEFADAYPNVAGRLRLSKDQAEDPHVARLLEGFAFLTARVRMKLDDMFPELSEAVLNALYPHLARPFPSVMMAEFPPAEDLSGPARIPAGQGLITQPADGEPCRFRTAYEVALWPLRLTAAELARRPFPAPDNPHAPKARACLKLDLEVTAPDTPLSALGLDELRFHITAEPRLAHQIYEAVDAGLLGMALRLGPEDSSPIFLPPSKLSPVGFDRSDSLVPLQAHASQVYALITEFFAFPDKFMAFDLKGLEAKTLLAEGGRLEVFLYLEDAPQALERAVTREVVRLFCAPAVNLFPQAAEPIRLDPFEAEYRVCPDARRESVVEVYQVETVTVAEPSGRIKTYRPFFAMAPGAAKPEGAWRAARRPSPYKGGGDDVYLSLAHAEASDSVASGAVASLDLLCTNRNHAGKLPFGGGQPRLTFAEACAGAGRPRALTPPSRPLRPPADGDLAWRLITQLSLNHLSITQGAQGALALKEIVSAYDLRRSKETLAQIDLVTAIDSRPATARAPGRFGLALCSGLDIALSLSTERFSGSGGYLLAAVLERFFANYCAVNSFTRLEARLTEGRGVLRRWPPRAGEQALV
ncbi:MAG: type VI secretion system baseplate subunit TssF [Maricaulaceae bacterium]